MSDFHSTMSHPARYQICVSGNFPEDLSRRYLGMSVVLDTQPGYTRSTLEGELPDQSALAGALKMIHEAHYAVLSVICLDMIADVSTISPQTDYPSAETSLRAQALDFKPNNER
jgi:hypothetical protein